MVKPRVVFDCMVYLQGAARPTGPAAACLRLAEAGFVELYVSDELLDEVADVLTRPRIQQRFPSLTTERIATFLTQLGQFSVRIAQVPSSVILVRDPKDQKYLNLALEAGARYLVSRDKDLLDLMDERRPEGQTLRSSYPKL